MFFSRSCSGAAQPVPEVRDGPPGPHPVLLRTGDPPEPRPHRTHLPARGEDAPQQAQTGNQVQAKEGERKSVALRHFKAVLGTAAQYSISALATFLHYSS